MTKRVLEKHNENDDDIEYFFRSIDMYKKLDKYLPFIEGEVKLESVVSFSQYIFRDIRMITMIGELHNKNFSCKGESISIAEYCKRAVIHNPKCRVLLEYNKGDDPTRIGSQAIRDTFIELTKIGKSNQIIPFDVRSFFITQRGQNDLYSQEYRRYSLREVENAFIKPFYKKQRENSKLFDLKGSYDENIRRYMLHQYFPDIINSFETASNMLKHNQNPHQVLKDCWKKVVDYYILAAILRKDDINNYIIIFGNAHHVNIQNVLSSLITRLNSQSGNKEECVRLFQTYQI